MNQRASPTLSKTLYDPISYSYLLDFPPSHVLLEPSEKHSESQEFIVLMEDAETVRIDTFFFDPRFTQPSDEFGWKATTFYDTVQP